MEQNSHDKAELPLFICTGECVLHCAADSVVYLQQKAMPEVLLVEQAVKEALPGQQALHLPGTSARHDE